MLGRATGINGGLAGSMNVTSPKDRLIGCFGIVGGSIAAATGAALALKRTGGVAVAYFGDGAMNQGYFFECLNFCKVLKPAGRARLREQRLRRVHAVRGRHRGADPGTGRGDGGAGRDDRRHERVDGARGRARAVGHARSGGGPYFVEAITYRFVGHSRSDPGKYRPEGELDRWRERDPLVVLRARLEAERRGAPLALDELEASVAAAARWRSRSAGSRRRSRSRAPSPSSGPEWAAS